MTVNSTSHFNLNSFGLVWFGLFFNKNVINLFWRFSSVFHNNSEKSKFYSIQELKSKTKNTPSFGITEYNGLRTPNSLVWAKYLILIIPSIIRFHIRYKLLWYRLYVVKKIDTLLFVYEITFLFFLTMRWRILRHS